MEVLYRLSYRGTLSWGREDSNLRRRSRQIYSLLPLAARAHPRPRPRKHSPERPIMVANATDFSTEWKPRARKGIRTDRKSTRLNSSHANISYAVFCLKK